MMRAGAWRTLFACGDVALTWIGVRIVRIADFMIALAEKCRERSRTPEGAANPAPTNCALTREIVDYLDIVLPRSYRCFAVADRDELAPWLKDHLPGLRDGVPRLVIVGRGRLYFIEILADGVPSEAQDDWACWCAAWGTSRLVVRSADDVRAALAHWNITTGAPA